MPQSGQHTYTGLVQLRQRGCLLQRPGPHQDCHAPAEPRSLPTEHQIQQPVQIHRLVSRNHLVRPVHPGAYLPLQPGESSLERLELGRASPPATAWTTAFLLGSTMASTSSTTFSLSCFLSHKSGNCRWMLRRGFPLFSCLA